MKNRMRQTYFSFLRILGNQTWIRWGLRYRIFCLLTPPTDQDFAVPFFGRTYYGNLNNFIDRSVFIYGAHEREAMVYMGSRIKKDAVVLDIGANVGHHSLFFSTKAKEVHAFEPNPKFRSQFEELMHKNHVDNVHLHQVGLGDGAQTLTYYAPVGDNQGIGSFVQGHHATNRDIGTLPIVAGDDFVASLKLSRVDFIKIDVERYEEFVLRGLQQTIRRFKPVIIMEYSEADFTSRQSFLSLTKGYKPYVLRFNKTRGVFFNAPECKLEPFDFSRASAEMLLEPVS